MTQLESTLPLFRSSDPETSAVAAAADARTQEARRVQKRAILSLLRERPMTDAALTDTYMTLARNEGWPVTQPDSVRKRRAELKNQGLVVAVGVSTVTRMPRTLWQAAR